MEIGDQTTKTIKAPSYFRLRFLSQAHIIRLPCYIMADGDQPDPITISLVPPTMLRERRTSCTVRCSADKYPMVYNRIRAALEGVVGADDLAALHPEGSGHFPHSALIILNCYLTIFESDFDVWEARQTVLEVIAKAAITDPDSLRPYSIAFSYQARFAAVATRTWALLRLDHEHRSVCSRGLAVRDVLMTFYWVEILSLEHDDVRIWLCYENAMITMDISATELEGLETRLGFEGELREGEPKEMMRRAFVRSNPSEIQPVVLVRTKTVSWRYYQPSNDSC